ncbi:hypothetical protein WDU94_015649 [Cyamophila willieti]
MSAHLRAGYWRRKKKPILNIMHKTLKGIKDLKTYSRMPYFDYDLELNFTQIKCESEIFKKSQLGLMQEFKSYKEKASADFIIFTDGSVNREKEKSSFGIYNEVTQESMGYKINKITSSWQVELLAIMEALKMLHDQEYEQAKIIIASDSKSAIASLNSVQWKSLNNEIILEVKYYYKKLITAGNEVTILWVPGHQGIPGNEKADEIAGKAIENGFNYDMKKSPDMKMAEIEEKIMKKYQQWYEVKSQVTGRQFNQLNLKVIEKYWFTGKMDRRLITSIIRMRNKHGRYPVHLHRMGIIGNDQCECGEKGDLEHVILYCKMRKSGAFLKELIPTFKF